MYTSRVCIYMQIYVCAWVSAPMDSLSTHSLLATADCPYRYIDIFQCSVFPDVCRPCFKVFRPWRAIKGPTKLLAEPRYAADFLGFDHYPFGLGRCHWRHPELLGAGQSLHRVVLDYGPLLQFLHWLWHRCWDWDDSRTPRQRAERRIGRDVWMAPPWHESRVGEVFILLNPYALARCYKDCKGNPFGMQFAN